MSSAAGRLAVLAASRLSAVRSRSLMSLYQQVFAWLGILQGFALFGVLLFRSHYRRMPLFTLYVGVLRVFSVVYVLDPTWETYMLHQVVSAALRFGLALELTNHIFGAFPGAAVTARRVMLLILVATAVTAMATAPLDATYTRVHAESVPRMASAAIWMITALAALVLWYRLPLAPLPRAVGANGGHEHDVLHPSTLVAAARARAGA